MLCSISKPLIQRLTLKRPFCCRLPRPNQTYFQNVCEYYFTKARFFFLLLQFNIYLLLWYTIVAQVNSLTFAILPMLKRLDNICIYFVVVCQNLILKLDLIVIVVDTQSIYCCNCCCSAWVCLHMVEYMLRFVYRWELSSCFYFFVFFCTVSDYLCEPFSQMFLDLITSPLAKWN